MLWGMVAVLLVAAALRFVACGQIPPGLYHDEAYHGLDALDVLRGRLSLYFPANNGREPLFIYLIALAVGGLGRSPFALRLVAVFAGLLTVAATGAMAQALFSRRVGLLAAAVLGVTLWHVHLSRVGFRAVLLPLFIALTFWQGALGVKRAGRRKGKEIGKGGGWRHWLAAGVLCGLSFYTYTAARFTPVALAAFGLYVLVTRPAICNLRSSNLQLLRGLGLAVLATLVTIAPLAAYTMDHPNVVLGRPGQVSVFNPTIHGGDLWGTLGAHALRTAGMFFVRGDRIWRHNVPWRPIFDPVLGGAFVLGLLVALHHVRRVQAAGLVLIWMGVMSLPTLLSEDAPHFLRSVGVLPMVACLPALGLDWLADQIHSLRSRRPAPEVRHWSPLAGYWSIIALPLLFSLFSTVWAYFGTYARDPMAGYWFERGAVALAGRVNQFLGVGWDGERMLHGGLGSQRIYLDPALWDEWQTQIRFLVAAPETVTVGFDKVPPSNPQVAIFAWPYGDWRRAWALLPAPSEITVEEGPLSQGDREPQPYTTYLAFFATPPDPTVAPVARFSGGVELLGVTVAPVRGMASLMRENTGALQVRLRWRATEPLMEGYTVFMHYLRDGEPLAQADSQPAGGHYPTTVWRAGDLVNDDHYVDIEGDPLPGRDVLRFGFWLPESGAVLYLLDEAGNPAGDWIEVPVGSSFLALQSWGS